MSLVDNSVDSEIEIEQTTPPSKQSSPPHSPVSNHSNYTTKSMDMSVLTPVRLDGASALRSPSGLDGLDDVPETRTPERSKPDNNNTENSGEGMVFDDDEGETSR